MMTNIPGHILDHATDAGARATLGGIPDVQQAQRVRQDVITAARLAGLDDKRIVFVERVYLTSFLCGSVIRADGSTYADAISAVRVEVPVFKRWMDITVAHLAGCSRCLQCGCST